jgi:predicted  nucleic acid-binding Zn-ribbon protein
MHARLELLRNHPDLSNLEPELLQLAAQMSMQTRDLARAYSDQKVDRARIFQRQRQEEAHAMGERLDLAQQICNELRLWMADIEAGESKNSTQINRLEADLAKILPDLCYAFDLQTDPSEGNVVTMPKSQKDPVLVGNRDNLN